MSDSITWTAEEHRHLERGSDWYWALGIIAVSSAATAVLFNNILFALLIIIAAGMLGALASRPPTLANFTLGERGLSVNDTLYPYEEMFAFWVSDDENPTLLIDTPRWMTPDLVIPLAGVNPGAVRAFLRPRVPEIELHESFVYTVMEFFGL